MGEPQLIIVGLTRGGRRRRSDAVSTDQVRTRLTTKERRGIERVASLERKSISQVIRDAVDAYVSDFSEEKVFRTTKQDQ
jgi:hypothetical protein